MRTRLLTTTGAAVLCLFAYSAQAFQAAPPPSPFNANESKSLECAIVRHTPERDRDPAYKITIFLQIEDGTFKSLDVGYTLVSGRYVDRSRQYENGRTWTAMPRALHWYWAGSRGQTSIQGHLYHNQRDGWMYYEQIVAPGNNYQMLADCHEVEGD
jgi:hypothetical protein